MPISFADIPKLFKKDKSVEEALKRYHKVVEKREKPKFRILGKELLLEKVKEAENILNACRFCERRCGANRQRWEKGYCQLGREMQISSFFEHHGEEQFFMPSFSVFFWSCNFNCQYCQNFKISQRKEAAHNIKEQELAETIDEHALTCKNLSLTGGEPTLQIHNILKTLSEVKSDIPVILNSNFYMSEETLHLLIDVVDVYLSDFKYGYNECAERLSKIPNYVEIVKRNHLLAAQDSELVIRHLVLPGHIECCTKPILDWISLNLGKKVIVNLMDQYKPEHKSSLYREINRYLEPKEFKEVVDYAKKKKLNVIY